VGGAVTRARCYGRMRSYGSISTCGRMGDDACRNGEMGVRSWEKLWQLHVLSWG
jgi:hypothetical protein